MMKCILASIVMTISISGCTICSQKESDPGVIIERNDSYMFWICTYFKETNDRWPGSTSELVEFLQGNYSNMIEKIRLNYKDTKYEISSDGVLTLETDGCDWSDKKFIQNVTVMTKEKARAISDEVARRELGKQEEIHRNDDPNVKLRLIDYEVTKSEDVESYRYFYEHNNPNVDFELWLGHPMHFTIVVNKVTGKADIIGGR